MEFLFVTVNCQSNNNFFSPSKLLMNTTVISKQINFWKKTKIALFENRAVTQTESLYMFLVMTGTVILVSKEGSLPWMKKQ